MQRFNHSTNPKINLTMGLQYRKGAIKLTYRDEKPTVYKAIQLTYPKIKEKDFVKYAANAAHVPEVTMQQCAEAIAQAITYYAINGMRVVIPDFGGFYLQFRTKTAPTYAECTADTIKFTGLAYAPATALRKLINNTSETFIDNELLSLEETPTPPTP